jgi:hypothetical protein
LVNLFELYSDAQTCQYKKRQSKYFPDIQNSVRTL